ncbi:MAG: RNA 2',3'-cyclic phosphodiesterase [Elusimicrobia bacterium]|nr:RNA 2',3'-cyclic phosphodiesterase [Elusimicrobiota bacterium]
MLRIFVALPLDESMAASLSRYQDDLKRSGANFKWTSPRQFHFTLYFNAEISEDRLEPLTAAVEASARRNPSFDLSLDHVGAFGSLSRPRVIWAGVGRGAEQIIRLAQDLHRELARRDFPAPDKPFVPHLTLGRMRSARNLVRLQQTLQGPAAAPFFAGQMLAGRLVLYRSELSASGAEHFPLLQAPLQGASAQP